LRLRNAIVEAGIGSEQSRRPLQNSSAKSWQRQRGAGPGNFADLPAWNTPQGGLLRRSWENGLKAITGQRAGLFML